MHRRREEEHRDEEGGVIEAVLFGILTGLVGHLVGLPILGVFAGATYYWLTR